jgi:hypothetical protein
VYVGTKEIGTRILNLNIISSVGCGQGWRSHIIPFPTVHATSIISSFSSDSCCCRRDSVTVGSLESRGVGGHVPSSGLKLDIVSLFTKLPTCLVPIFYSLLVCVVRVYAYRFGSPSKAEIMY